MVQWTISRAERAEHKRRAGDAGTLYRSSGRSPKLAASRPRAFASLRRCGVRRGRRSTGPSAFPGSPEHPTQDARQQPPAMHVRMGAVTPFITHVIARAGYLLFVGIGVGPLQRRQHLLIGQVPVAMLVVEVRGAILQENADGPDGILADQARIGVAARDHG